MTRTLLCFLALATGLLAHERRRNVLLICVDDLKPLLGCYGDKQAITPGMDRLAARGMRFDLAFCNQSVCAPSRNTLMLGSRSTSLGIYDLGTNFRRAVPDAVTLPQYFRRFGYRAEAVGKILHTGHGNTEDEASWSVPLFHEKVVEYHDPASTGGGQLTREEAYFSNRELGRIHSLPKGAAWEKLDVPDETYADGRIAAEAIRRLQAAKDRADTPFFLAVGFVKPHLPFTPPKKYWDLYDPAKFELSPVKDPPAGSPAYAGKRAGEISNFNPIPDGGNPDEETARHLIHGYYASTSYVDAQIAKVIAELDRLELAENTVIVLWGDHGWHLGDMGIWTKHTNYEQANRIPLLVVAPGVAKPGSSTAAPVETVDIYPTLAALAGLPSPEVPQPIDGLDLVPLLRDPTLRPRDHAYGCFPRGDRMGRTIRTGRYRLVEWREIGAPADTAEFELFDYADATVETVNLAKQRPEIVAELRAMLDRHPEPLDRPRAEPSVANRELHLSCECLVGPETSSGVLISHGGDRHGYVLHLDGGVPSFGVRIDGKLTELTADRPVSGEVTLVATLTPDVMTLSANGETLATRPSPGLLPHQPAESMLVGRDEKTAVGRYDLPHAFAGKIRDASVRTRQPR